MQQITKDFIKFVESKNPAERISHLTGRWGWPSWESCIVGQFSSHNGVYLGDVKYSIMDDLPIVFEVLDKYYEKYPTCGDLQELFSELGISSDA